MCKNCKETQKFWSLLFFFSVVIFMMAGMWAWYNSQKELSKVCVKLQWEKEKNYNLKKELSHLEGYVREIEYISRMEPTFEAYDAKIGEKLSKNLASRAIFERLETFSRNNE